MNTGTISLKQRVVRTLAAALACLALSGAPVQAQGVSIRISFSNWYEGHHEWLRRCYPEPRDGHWGRDRRYDGWCASYHRFRDDRPDRDWRRDHEWDRGREHDHR